MYTPAYTDEHASVQVLNYHRVMGPSQLRCLMLPRFCLKHLQGVFLAPSVTDRNWSGKVRQGGARSAQDFPG
jgi:hypothetical protein